MFLKHLIIIFIVAFSICPTTQAVWGPDYCKRQCTQDACASDARRIGLCETHCQGTLEALKTCKALNNKPPILPQPGSQPSQPPQQATRPLPVRPSAGPIGKPATTAPKAQTQISSPIETSSHHSLNDNVNEFYKRFTSDLTSALKFTACITKTITVTPETFKSNIFHTLKNKIVGNKTSYKDYETYLIYLGQYEGSMISPNLIEQTKVMAEKGLGTPGNLSFVVYNNTLQEFIEKNRRLAQQIALKIPGYTNPGPLPPGPAYLKSLPKDTLEELKMCVGKILFSTPELTKFKNEFFEEKNVRHVQGQALQMSTNELKLMQK